MTTTTELTDSGPVEQRTGAMSQTGTPATVSKLTPQQQAALPKSIIVDLDGTLCLRTTRRVYDESPGAVLTDKADPAVLAVIQAFHGAGHQILFTSARRETCREDTEAWLAQHLSCATCIQHEATPCIPYELFMRAADDGRKDAVVKRELYLQRIFDRFHVVAVFDDRDQVVDMWRSLGLKCMQVAPGDF